MGSGAGSGAGGFIDAGGTYLGARYESKALERQAAFTRQQAEFNARQAEREGKEAIKRGKQAVSRQQQDLRQLIGSQRVALAAQGIVIDEGTASTLQEQTREIGLLDSLTIRNNAMKEAYGYKFEALQLRTQGMVSEAALRTQAAGVRFAGTVSAISKGAEAAGKFGSSFVTGGAG